MSDRTHPIKVKTVRELREKCGKSWSTIAKECDVNVGSVMRWLEGKPVRMDHIGLLAKSLGTSADKLILREGAKDSDDYVKGEIIADDEHRDVAAILEAAQKALGAKYKIMVMYAGTGSIRIGINIHASDAVRLLKAFVQGKLDDLSISSISFTNKEAATQPDTGKLSKKEIYDMVKSAISDILNAEALSEKMLQKARREDDTPRITKYKEYKKDLRDLSKITKRVGGMLSDMVLPNIITRVITTPFPSGEAESHQTENPE